MKKCTKCLEIQPLSNFSKNGKKFGIRSNCKKCDYNRKNKFLSTEKGFLEAIYRNMINRKEASDNGSNRGKVYAVEFTFEQLMKVWEKHKLKYGQNCIYTNEHCRQFWDLDNRPPQSARPKGSRFFGKFHKDDLGS